MKKNIITSAMVAIMVSQCLAVSSCQKEPCFDDSLNVVKQYYNSACNE